MKLLQRSFYILATSVAMMACNNSGTNGSASGTDTTRSDSSGTAMTDTMHSTKDTTSMASPSAGMQPVQDLINTAVPANTKEMIWLKAGIAKGSSAIKTHATMMLKDHMKLDKDVAAFLAKKPSITKPSVDTANVVDINDKTGSAWDKAWIDKMVSDHSDLLKQLHQFDNMITDADAKKLLAGAIPVVQSHLDMVKKLDASMK